MRISHTAHQLYAHLTWATEARLELVDDRVKKELGSIINEIADAMGYEIIAFETVSDHVHLLVRYKPTHRISDFIKMVKGKSSRVIPYLLNRPLSWQKGYGVTSVGPKSLRAAIRYVEQQRVHHPERNL